MYSNYIFGVLLAGWCFGINGRPTEFSAAAGVFRGAAVSLFWCSREPLR